MAELVTIKKIKQQIVEKYSPKKIILFDSQAKGTAGTSCEVRFILCLERRDQ